MEQFGSIFFLGIGGIGMSALARYFHKRGVQISGYDRNESDITRELASEGMKIFYEDQPGLLTEMTDMAIYTPAIKSDNRWFAHFSGQEVPFLKRAEVLGMISKGIPTIAVAGTHGKTTISSMLTHIMVEAGKKVEALLGGISGNYQTNYVGSEDPDWMILEADEFDRSFLHLQPHIALITAMDADHLDIYGSFENMRDSFAEFVSKIDQHGILMIKEGLFRPFFAGTTMTYHTNAGADYFVKDHHVANGQYFVSFGGKLNVPETLLGLPGKHNMENALAASALAHLTGVEPGLISSGLSSFKGVKRRFEIRFSRNNAVYIDDYAHHPEEIKACIEAAREIYPSKKMTGIFQPHLYSRTRDFAAGFAESLSMLDELYLLDIYPAREEPIRGISSAWLLEQIPIPRKKLITKEELPEIISRINNEILITMGAGDIDKLAGPIVKLLEKKFI